MDALKGEAVGYTSINRNKNTEVVNSNYRSNQSYFNYEARGDINLQWGTPKGRGE